MALYGDDLAYVQAAGFSDLAARAVAALLPHLLARGVRRVVDVGSGAGATTHALVEAGFETLAIEPSAALLAIARRAAPNAEFREVSVYETSLPPCDAILALGEPLTYHEPEADADARLRGFFATAHAALRPRGLLAFDLVTAGGEPLDARGWASGDDWAVLYETREDAAAKRLTRHIETFRRTPDGSYRRARETHHVRLFEAALVRAWLEAADFDVETAPAYGDVTLPPRRLAFLATRR